MKTGFDITKARRLMEEEELDCMIATSHDNVLYSSGADLMAINMLKRLTAIILPLKGEPVFCVHANEEALSRNSSWIDDFRVYEGGEWEPLKPVSFIADILIEKGLSRITIGIEMLEIPHLYLDCLQESLPSAKFADCKPIFDRMRAIKSQEELMLLSEANMATAKAITVAFQMARPGDTERKIAENMIKMVYEYGADQVGFITLGAGENIFEIHHVPGGYTIKNGDFVHVDFGCFFNGYMSDISRVAVVGKPNDMQSKLYDVAVRAEKAVAEAMKEGTRIIEVHQAAKRFYESEGLTYNKAFIGHSLGIGCHEFPFLGPTHGDWVLESCMFFQIEPRVTLGNLTVHTEDSFIVTSAEAKNVSEYQDVTELQIIK
jgi:Xaa-Pro aminopeptidase